MAVFDAYANQQALNPVTGQLLGPNSSVAIGTLVPGSGSPTNGIFTAADGIANTTYTFNDVIADGNRLYAVAGPYLFTTSLTDPAAPVITGSEPGRPRHTGHVCTLGCVGLNSVEQPQKILLSVRSWT